MIVPCVSVCLVLILQFTIQSILPGQREKQVQKMIQLEEEALAREETKVRTLF